MDRAQPKDSIFPSEYATRWQPLKVLGQGWEGIVYLVRDRHTEERGVLKVFHKPIHEVWVAGLQTYESGVLDEDCAGLSSMSLVQDSDQVLGIIYPYRWLYPLNRRILWSVDQIGQSLLGTYCQMQCYLMTQHNLGLWDVSADNFRLDGRGQFWYIDFGYGIASLDNPVCADRGLFEYGFVMLLLSIYDLNIRLTRPQATGYSYTERCSYCTELADLDSRCDWIEPILSLIHDQTGAIFLDPEFYRQIGEQLPRRVAWPVPVMVASESLSGMARLRIALRKRLLSMTQALRRRR